MRGALGLGRWEYPFNSAVSANASISFLVYSLTSLRIEENSSEVDTEARVGLASRAMDGLATEPHPGPMDMHCAQRQYLIT